MLKIQKANPKPNVPNQIPDDWDTYLNHIGLFFFFVG